MSGRTEKELEGVSLLGNKKVSYPSDYAPEVLETFPNKQLFQISIRRMIIL